MLREPSAAASARRSASEIRPDKRERGFGPALLDAIEGADRRRHVVQGLEVPRGEQARPERVTLAEFERLQIDDVRDDRRGDTEPAKDVDQETRGHNVLRHTSQRGAGDRGMAEVIGGFATPVVQDHGPAEQACREDRWQGREQKRRVRRREDVNDVRAYHLPQEQREVCHLVHNSAEIFHTAGELEPARKYRIDRDQPSADVRIAPPGAQQAIRLNRLTAENAERGSDERDAQRCHAIRKLQGRGRFS